ncbi:cytochrome c peroxidase [Photobacterium sp. MCCC 1A19761]|uniref:cytochrome-c peroxidase n=1 Tax=Photobacterium sp. MCCC 1A19761 TaxID=3115000 RepID=UPI00307DF3DD
MKSLALTLSLAVGGLSAYPTTALADNNNDRNTTPFGLSPLGNDDFRVHSPAQVELGKNLFFDKILSGNKNISCGTCHHTLTNTTDGLSLPVGEGGDGLGINRTTGEGDEAIVQRVPHNSPSLFNLGAHQFTVLFNDGRIFTDPGHPSGFTSPAGDALPEGLDSVLAAQAMLPVTNPTEMAGQPGENPVADAAAANILAGDDGVWELLTERLRKIPDYVKQFKAAYPDINSAKEITFVHAANAIAAFEGIAWRADNSPFDRFLRGDENAMSQNAIEGMTLFYNGKSEHNGMQTCASCHSGTLQTDHDFHAIAMPQIGPGKGDGFKGLEDFGHSRVSGNDADRYKFRTPSLRNILLTAPYGHVGAYNTLRAVVEHHINAIDALNNYDQSQAVLPSRRDLDALDFEVMNNLDVLNEIAGASEIQQLQYNSHDVEKIMAFLFALTDPASLDLRSNTPKVLPSGLPLAD